MGERKGVNKYYPPDYDPSKGSINKYHGTHALRERARKLSQGILIIRFEMPYNIWCEGCNNHIGMGVRYNAEKKKVGNYYTTPIYQFRMKCHLCNNHFEMKTDPQNFDYVIVSGARRQERRWDPTDNEQVAPDDNDFKRKLAADAMFQLEHGTEDMNKSKSLAPSLAQLESYQSRWKDDYMANKILRSKFRQNKTQLQEKEKKEQALLLKSSLNIKLLEEDPKDIQMASLLKLTAIESYQEQQQKKREQIQARPLFSSNKNSKEIVKKGLSFLEESTKKLILLQKHKIETHRKPDISVLFHKSTDEQSTVININPQKTELIETKTLLRDTCDNETNTLLRDTDDNEIKSPTSKEIITNLSTSSLVSYDYSSSDDDGD